MNPLLKKIIRSGVGRVRFIMATIGLGVALLLILLAVQTQVNFDDLLHGKYNENETADFLVINKEVNKDNQTQKEKNVFSEADIADLKKQPFTQSIGLLTATRFSVTLESYSAELPFSTDMSFESVPNEFVDVKNKDWKWDEGQQDLPIIIPSFFLDLYNFGMAQSREELPQISPEALMMVRIKINITGNGQTIEIPGHVIGMTDRINSVLIPESFMKWANAKYGYHQQQQRVTRIVLKTQDPSDPALASYLQEKKLRTNEDKTRFSKARTAVNIIVKVLAGFGVVMLLFALLVFSLFIQLTIAGCKAEIELLITLGASPKQLGKFLMKQFFPVNVIIMIACALLIATMQFGACSLLKAQNMYVSPWISGYTITAAVAVLAMVWWVYKSTISKYVNVKTAVFSATG
ncbi:MAG: hypothetical protein ABIX01_23855 [Chitinophagaceae bacterium]